MQDNITNNWDASGSTKNLDKDPHNLPQKRQRDSANITDQRKYKLKFSSTPKCFSSPEESEDKAARTKPSDPDDTLKSHGHDDNSDSDVDSTEGVNGDDKVTEKATSLTPIKKGDGEAKADAKALTEPKYDQYFFMFKTKQICF